MHSGRDLGDPGLAPGHEGHALGIDRQPGGQPGQDFARAGAHDSHRGPLVGDRGQPHPQVRPLGLQPLLEVIQYARRTAGRGGRQVSLGTEPDNHPVVEEHPVGLAHHAVAARADRQSIQGVGVDPVQKFEGVGPLDVDLSQGGDVLDSHSLSGGRALALHGCLHRLSGLRVVPRTFPLPHVFEDSAVGQVPGVDRRHPDRVEQGAPVAAGHQCENDRRIGRPEGGGPDGSHRLAQLRRHDGAFVDPGGFSLV